MYFTSGQDRAFERLMQEKPGFDHYDGGGANAPEDCSSCRFYRPDWKYQYCVYAECPYQPGKLTALAAVKFTVKGADDDMAVFRVEKNKGYTVMSNHHLRNKALSLKAKGLLSQMLSLPEDWDYTLKGLSLINRESIDAIRTAVWELERAGYIRREQGRDAKGKMADMVYTIYEQPVLDKPVLENPVLENPTSDNPTSDNPASENPTQLNKEIQNKEKPNTDLILSESDAIRKTVKENIELDLLCRNMLEAAPILQEIYELIVETIQSQSPTLRLGSNVFPAELVRERMVQLNSEHIRFVLDSFRARSGNIRNPKKYLLAMLFNAPITLNSKTAIDAQAMLKCSRKRQI